ncbi:glycosyltransferase [Massilia sp. SM-13]|uniref:glycosyltransferase n=1 Tax=Pseudoduganella rhizocola TaxID=3382643 RepID=UPI0038B44A80
MKILFIHQNFPGQFIHLSAALAQDPQNRVVALGMNDRSVPAGVELRRYSLLRESQADTHPLLKEQENHVLRAEACASAAFQLKREGFEPDIIVAHPGWGEALFIKDVFPQAKLLIYCEYYYALEGQDVGFDPDEPPLNFQQKARLRLKNTTNLLSLQIADAAISPTEWQKSTYPAWAREKITVIHDGIDLGRLRFDAHAQLTLQRGHGQVRLSAKDEVLTYVARNLEPVRGFHMLMRVLPEVLKRRPTAHAVIVGGNEISYGQRAPDGQDWKTFMLAELAGRLDLGRVHFVGKVPYQDYLNLLNISRAHLYWTTPFVLSWSFLEAALSGLTVIASDTSPVREFAHFPNIQTAGFFDQRAFAELSCSALAAPFHRGPPSAHDLAVGRCVQLQKALIAQLLDGSSESRVSIN